MNNLNVFAEISKVDEENRMVYGYASTEALDQQGERVSKIAIEEALPDYLKFGNIREMHSSSAVGTAEEATIDEKGLYIAAKVVDDNAWKKVKEKVYKGFSIGGKRIEKIKDTITKLRLSEISLVDRPANPEAIFDIYKADDGSSHEGAQEVEPNEEIKEMAPEKEELKKSDDLAKAEMNDLLSKLNSTLSTMSGAMEKLAEKNEALEKRVAEFEKQPEPPKAALHAIAKTEDNAVDNLDDEIKKFESEKDAVSIIKMIHADKISGKI